MMSYGTITGERSPRSEKLENVMEVTQAPRLHTQVPILLHFFVRHGAMFVIEDIIPSLVDVSCLAPCSVTRPHARGATVVA